MASLPANRSWEERPSFNLDLLLGQDDVRHYLRFIQGGGREFVVGEGQMPPRVPFPVVLDETEQERDFWVPSETLVLRGTGPYLASSSCDVAVTPEIVWDVCGYYARLHLHWTATKAQIRDAYFALDGITDNDINYAVKQLLNEDTRWVYDRVPLGQLFMADRDVQGRLKRQGAREAARAAARGESMTADEALASMGIVRDRALRNEKDSARDIRARAMAQADFQNPLHRPGDMDGRLGSSVGDWELLWSYYLMTGRLMPDGRQLECWQLLVGAEFRRYGFDRYQFAVGFSSVMGFDVDARTSEGRPIILLGTEPPEPYLARKAVREIMARDRGDSHASSYPGRRQG